MVLIQISFLLVLPSCSDWSLSKGSAPLEPGETIVDHDKDGYPAADDCDDADASVHPDAEDHCDDRDGDCDGSVDEDAVFQDWYLDADADAYGNTAVSVSGCHPPEGHVADAGDCEDDEAEVNPGAPERCGNDRDDDCDGLTDEADAVDASAWYPDTDGDGYGGDGGVVYACNAPSGHVGLVGDCDDSDTAIHPGAVESCDGLDNDCDGVVDEEDAIDVLPWHPDADGDGRGDPDLAAVTEACEAPVGYVADATDCDDSDATYPGSLDFDQDHVTLVFTGTTPQPTVEIGGVAIPMMTSINELAAGSYRVPEDYDVCYFVANAYSNADLDFAELQTYDETNDAPPVNDRYFATLQWNLHTVRAADAWQCSTGGGVVVAVIDTGISSSAYDGFGGLTEGGKCDGAQSTDYASLVYTSLDDPDDPGHVWITHLDGTMEECTYTRPRSTDVCWRKVQGHTSASDRCASAGDGRSDAVGHGTHVAGTINQATGNGVGVAGLAPGASLVPIDAAEGDGDTFNAYSLAASIVYAVAERGAMIINMSLGPGDCDARENRLRYNALKYASDHGVLVSISSGNGDCDHLWTTYERASALPGILLVGNAARSDRRSFSYERASGRGGSNFGVGLDIMAPGTDILQGYAAEHGCGSGTVGISGVALCPKSGTSMAAPHVAAAAALLMAGGANAAQAETYLQATAHLATGWDPAEHGNGLLDAAAALEAWTGCTCLYREGESLGLVDGACATRDTPHWSTSAGCTTAETFSPTGRDWGDPGSVTVVDDEDLFTADVNHDFRDDLLSFDSGANTWSVVLALTQAASGHGSSHTVPTTPVAVSGLVTPPVFPGCPAGGWVNQALVGDTDASGAADLVIWCTDGSWWRSLASDDGGDGDAIPDSFGAWQQWKSGFGQWEELAFTAGLTGNAPTCDLGWSMGLDFDDDGDSDATSNWYGSAWNGLLADMDGDGAADPVIHLFGSWYVALSGSCESSTCQNALASHLWVSGFGDDDIYDRMADGAAADAVWYAAHAFDADGNGTADLVNFYNNGDWWVIPEESAYAAWRAGAPLQNSGFSQWLAEGGDSADAVLVGNFNGDRYPDILAAYVNDGRSISCEMTEIMIAQGSGTDTCGSGTGVCGERGGADPTVCGTSGGYRDYVCNAWECLYELDPVDGSMDFLGYDCGAGGCDDCDGGWGTSTTAEWHVHLGQDADGDSTADRFRPAAESRVAWISGVSGTYAGHRAADIDGDGVTDVVARDGDDSWDAWLAGGLSCP